MFRSRWSTALALALLAAGSARAQDAPKDPPEERSTGLPPKVDWKFNFDAGWGAFGFGNSLYTDPKEGVPENYGSNWAEGFAKPALSGSYKFSGVGEAFGKISAVGERTYASPPPLVGVEESSFLPEDLYVGYRTGAFDLTVGRAPFTIGHGFLLWDGAAEGGSRGGYWSNARKAFAFATIARFKPSHHTLEAFFLKKDDLPEHKTGTQLWGGNYEFRIGESSTFGATYMKFQAHEDVLPRRNELNVYNARAYTAPIPMLKDLSFELEYAAERNHDLVHSDAWTAQGAYQISSLPWKPKLSYRYAHFEGDDPATARDEAFDPLLLGFSDWGTWWQGEIAGEYFLSNSNLNSHEARLHVTPNASVSGGLIFFKFLLDHPESYAPGVTNKNVAVEGDAYVDWKINGHFTASFVAAGAEPQKAVEQSSGRTANFRYGMVFLAYSY